MITFFRRLAQGRFMEMEAFLAGRGQGTHAPALPKPLLAPCLKWSCWPKKVTWLSPAAMDSGKDQSSQWKDPQSHCSGARIHSRWGLVASSVSTSGKIDYSAVNLEPVGLFGG